MTITFEAPGVTVHHGDCIEVMRTIPDASIDAIVTDPPYGLDFMGKGWDDPKMLGQLATGHEQRGAFAYGGTHSRGYADHDGRAFERWVQTWASEALRVLKPGGHLLAFGGSRTWHRLASGIEDAGFEIRDSIAWLYGSGFPKSLDVSKAIDAAAGAKRTVVRGVKPGHEEFVNRTDSYSAGSRGEGWDSPWKNDPEAVARSHLVYEPATEEAAKWEGWGTALKPAFEPIVVARKPLVGTVAANVLAHGTGALNIDATRTAFQSEADRRESTEKNQHAKFGTKPGQNNVYGDYSTTEIKDYDSTKGRWPTNVGLDEFTAAELDKQTGTNMSRGHTPSSRKGASKDAVYALGHAGQAKVAEQQFEDVGGASRFFPKFRYEAKAGSDERPNVNGVQHPTVKPLELMRWLVRLVTPPGGTILEPFAGSGTTLEAALLEGFSVIGVEREADYIPLIEARITKPLQPAMFGDWEVA